MDVRIEVSAGDVIGELTALRAWLREERDLAGAVEMMVSPPSEGELGGAVELLTVALGTGGAGVALARSLTTWLRTRRPDVVVTVKTQAGTVKVEARDLSPDDVMPLLQQVLQHDDA